jgi:hypothetical protein
VYVNIPERFSTSCEPPTLFVLVSAKKTNPEHTTLTFVAQADLKGWIPGWAMSSASGPESVVVSILDFLSRSVSLCP